MEMEDLLISTGVDSLIRIIQEKKRVELAMASQLLKLPQNTIEDWAHILEEEGIIKIEYQLTKVYFTWVVPTVEEIEKERQVFTKRKSSLEEESEKLEKIQKEGNEELEEYGKAIEKISEKFSSDFAKVDALASQLKAAKEERADVSRKAVEKIDSLQEKLSEIDGSIKGLELQLEKTAETFGKKEIDSKLGSINEAKKHIDELGRRMNELMSRADELKAHAPKEDVDLGGAKEGFSQLQADFRKMHEDSEYLRSIVSEFKANADTINDAVSHIKELSASAEKTSKRIREQHGMLEALKKELPELEKQLAADLEIADQYSETISIAQEILENVPTKKDILSRLEALEKEEARISKDFRKVETSLSGVAGNVLAVGDLMEELEEMRSSIEEARSQLSEDADEILSSIEEETATYATFQKIKAKAKIAIDAYITQLAKIRQETSQLKEDLKAAQEQSEKKMGEMAGEASDESIQKVAELISQLQEKKEELAKIRALIADLTSRSRMIEKNIKLLSKSAKLISLREEGVPGGKAGKKGADEKSAKSQAALTAEEQEEFERKRKELKGLIRKLWETD